MADRDEDMKAFFICICSSISVHLPHEHMDKKRKKWEEKKEGKEERTSVHTRTHRAEMAHNIMTMN